VSAYLIVVQDTEDGVVHPKIIGPFVDYQGVADVAAARQFKRQWLPDEWGPPDGQGGYYAVHLITDETCDYTPSEWIKMHKAVAP
jgi:hypothetical protein